MTAELLNLALFVRCLATVALLCGFAPAVLILTIAECCGWKIVPVKIVGVGVEKVSGQAVSRNTSSALSDGNKPARNLDWRAA